MKRLHAGSLLRLFLAPFLVAGCGQGSGDSEYRYDQHTFLLNLENERIDLGDRSQVDLRRDGRPEAVIRQCRLGKETRRVVQMNPDTELRFRSVVKPASVLRFELAFAPKVTPPCAVDCEVLLGGDGEDVEVVWSHRLEPDTPEERRWLEVEVPLGDRATGDVILRSRLVEDVAEVNRDHAPGWANPVISLASQTVDPVSSPPRNAVIFLVDTLRADHLDVYGHDLETSPHLTELAAEGFVFRQAHSVTSWTKPSVASLFTSRLPSQHGAEDYQDRMKNAETTLAEVFAASGYRTGAVGHAPFVFSPKFNLQQGFQDSYEVHATHGTETSRADDVVDQAVDWITRHRDEPFLLYIQVVDPHEPYFPPDEERARYVESSYAGELDGSLQGEGTHRGRSAEQVSEQDLRHLEGLYDAEIAFMDKELGRLVDHLKALGLWDETAFVFTADHGEEFLDHGQWAHGQTLYQEQIRVPLVIKPPKSAGLSPRHTDTIVSLLDVAPTLCRFARIPTDETPFIGQDLTALFRSSNLWEDRMILGELRKADFEAYSIRRGDVKYIATLSPAPFEAVYRLGADPEERNNLLESTDERILETFRNTVEGVRASRQLSGLYVEFLGDGTPAEVAAVLACEADELDFSFADAEILAAGDDFTLVEGRKPRAKRIEMRFTLGGEDLRDAVVLRTVPQGMVKLTIQVDGQDIDPGRILLGGEQECLGTNPVRLPVSRPEFEVDTPPAWEARDGIWCRVWNLRASEVALEGDLLESLRAIGYIDDE